MIRSAAGTFTLRVIATAATLILNVLVARLLGTEGFGVISYVIAWANLLAVPAILGMDVLVMRNFSAWTGQQRWPEIKGLLRFSSWSVAAASSLVAAAAATVHVVAEGRSWSPDFVIGMALVPLIAVIRLTQGAMRGFHRIVQGQFAELLTRPAATLLLVAVGAVVLGPALNPTGVLIAYVVAALIAVTLGMLRLRQTIPVPVRAAVTVTRPRAWLVTALPLLLIGGVQVANRQIDVVMVGALAGAESAGVYAAAARAAELISFVLFAVNAGLAPRIARLFALGELVALQALVTRAARYTLLMTLPLAGVLIAFGSTVLGFFGPAFVVGVPALTIMSVAQLLNAAAGSVVVVLTMTGGGAVTAVGVGAGLVVNVILNAVLVPVLQYNGAAIAASASLLTWNAILVVMLRHRIGLDSTVMGVGVKT